MRVSLISLLHSSTLGAHINPAVTLAFAAARRMPLRKVPIYIIAQMIAGIIASAVVYGLYYGRF